MEYAIALNLCVSAIFTLAERCENRAQMRLADVLPLVSICVSLKGRLCGFKCCVSSYGNVLVLGGNCVL